MGALRVISRESGAFRDRREAGRYLAAELDGLRGQHPVILGIPRGGVILADELAQALDGDLDVVLARKLRAPGNPEFAIGSVSENGAVLVDEQSARHSGADERYLRQETALQVDEIARRRERFRQVRPKVELAGRVVVVTDDGLATGATMQAALSAVRQEKPARLICAVPVGAEDSVLRLAPYADELVCLQVPPLFMAVGRFYEVFDQTDDSEVLQVLSRWGRAGSKVEGGDGND